MSESTPLPNPPQDSLFIALLALKYALAGDLESHEPLELIEQRVRTIDWNDPAFIEFSDKMRAGVPKLTPEQEVSLRPSLLALVHAQTEKINLYDEEVRLAVDKLKIMAEQQTQAIKNTQEQQAQTDRLFRFNGQMLELYKKMIDRLHVLGDDVSEYELPKL